MDLLKKFSLKKLPIGLASGGVIAQNVLPFPTTPTASIAKDTMADSTHKRREEPTRLTTNAPNILIILMDDVGPGTPSTYGD